MVKPVEEVPSIPAAHLPVTVVDPLPILKEALAAMQRSIDNQMEEIDKRVQSHNRATLEALSILPELVQSQVQQLQGDDTIPAAAPTEKDFDLPLIVKTLGEIGRKVQRREMGIGEFDKRVRELLTIKGQEDS